MSAAGLAVGFGFAFGFVLGFCWLGSLVFDLMAVALDSARRARTRRALRRRRAR